MDEKQVTQEALEGVSRAAEEINDCLLDWYEKAEEQLTEWYLVFEDFGLVEPLYDPASTCGSTEEEWEIFQ